MIVASGCQLVPLHFTHRVAGDGVAAHVDVAERDVAPAPDREPRLSRRGNRASERRPACPVPGDDDHRRRPTAGTALLAGQQHMTLRVGGERRVPRRALAHRRPELGPVGSVPRVHADLEAAARDLLCERHDPGALVRDDHDRVPRVLDPGRPAPVVPRGSVPLGQADGQLRPDRVPAVGERHGQERGRETRRDRERVTEVGEVRRGASPRPAATRLPSTA